MRSYIEYLAVPYKHISGDCYALVKKFYTDEFGIHLPSLVYAEDWAGQGISFIDDNYKLAGFGITDTNEFRLGNIIVLGDSGVPKHLGISLGDGTFLHTTTKGTARHRYINSAWSPKIVYTLEYRG
jgi:cell wall-associated NlpC family hydrolase